LFVGNRTPLLLQSIRDTKARLDEEFNAFETLLSRDPVNAR
jgi:hypothetical protein